MAKEKKEKKGKNYTAVMHCNLLKTIFQCERVGELLHPSLTVTRSESIKQGRKRQSRSHTSHRSPFAFKFI